MNWDSILQSAIIGALIGGVIGIVSARKIMTTRRAFLDADLAHRKLVARSIRADWFHIGTSARFKVELATMTTAARVDRKGSVTWEREPT